MAGKGGHFPPPRGPDQFARHDWAPHCLGCGAALVPLATHEDGKLSPASVYASSKLAQADLLGVN